MKQTLSVVISAYNEASTIKRCLSSVTFADEIILIDNSSADDTRQIAQSLGAKIFSRPNQLMLNTNKNFGFEKATGDWILNLDADEEITPSLGKEIKKIITSNPQENGFWIKRKNFSFGKWIQYGLWWPDKQLRLFKLNEGQFPCVHIHEYIKVEGKIGELHEPYNHYNYETVHQYLLKIDRASSSEAIYLKETNYQLSWFDAIRFPVSDFLKIFFAQKGYKDGLHGLVLALFQTFYSFCVFAKMWEMQGFPQKDMKSEAITRELERNGQEAKYWILTTTIEESKNTITKFINSIKRKLIKIRS